MQTKLTAHTLYLYRNRLLGQADWLQIKALAFAVNYGVSSVAVEEGALLVSNGW